jgi:AraC-like DNA-binding protein
LEKSYSHDYLISPYLFKIKKEIESGNHDPVFLEESFHILLEKLYLVHKNVRDEILNLPFQKLSTKYELYKRLNLAKDFIDTVCNTKISLKKISSEACLCTHHFIRLFKLMFGVSPYQYLIKKRLENSFNLLLKTELPVNVISDTAGFVNASSFTRIFKTRYSHSPEKFREINRRKKSILVKH